MKLVGDDIFVRIKVVEEINKKVLEVAKEIVDKNIRWYGADEKSAEDVADVMLEHFDLNEFTSEEFDFAVTWIHFYCAVKTAYEAGILKDDTDIPPGLID